MSCHVPASRVRDECASFATVDAEIHEITGPGEMFGSDGVCDHCHDEEESVVALVTFYSEPRDHLILWGLCYRELSVLALGDVSYR